MDTIATEPSGVKSTLPSRYYFAPDIYEQEKEKIFYRSWFCVGRADEIPEPRDYFVRSVADESIVVIRGEDRALNAFYNVCRHRGNRLCAEGAGKLKGRAITCAYHAWSYGLDGRLIATPNMVDAEGFRREDYPLHRVSVHPWEGFVFLNLSPDPGPFEPNLGRIAARLPRYNLEKLTAGRRKTYDIQANWKLIVENFTECYHCPTVHPELCRIIPGFRNGVIFQEESDGARFIEGGNSTTMDASTRRPLISTITDEDANRFRSTTIYPNLLCVFVPDHVQTWTLWPMGPKATRVVFELLYEAPTLAAPGFDDSDAASFMELVNQQDFGICERVQEGLQSRAHRGGVYSPQEHLPQKFNEWVLQHLGA